MAFSYEEAAARGTEIYDLVPSVMLPDFEFPVGRSLRLHISRTGDIQPYGDPPPLLWNGEAVTSLTLEEVDALLTLWGTCTCTNVLLTSACDPGSSETLPLLMDILFSPIAQVFYPIARELPPPGD